MGRVVCRALPRALRHSTPPQCFRDADFAKAACAWGRLRRLFGDQAYRRAWPLSRRHYSQQPRDHQSDFGADVTMIAELKLPTLIVWGSRDRLIPQDYAERFHRDIAGSTMVVFPDLGHVPHEEDPVRTVAAVIDFLRSK
jgi:pimeloyl-ACP methyl ester carboxylesterase